VEAGPVPDHRRPRRHRTSLADINDRDQILGVRVDPDGVARGVVLDHGRVTSFAVPDRDFAFVIDINNRRQIVGKTFDPDAVSPQTVDGM
jgi:hypothetical protein